jgi:hypothetical protein
MNHVHQVCDEPKKLHPKSAEQEPKMGIYAGLHLSAIDSITPPAAP